MSKNNFPRVLGGFAAVAVAGALSLSAPATAEAQMSVGVQGSYGTEIEAAGVGARLDYTIPGADGFGLLGSFDLFFPDNVDYWEINANGTYTFATEGGSVAPYVGAGLNIANLSNGASVTDEGLNLLGGIEFGSGSGVTPFLEGRYGTSFDGQFVITGGILF